MLLEVGRRGGAVEVVSHPSQRFSARQEEWGRCIVGGLPGPDNLAGVEFTLDQFKAELAGTGQYVRLEMIGRWGNRQAHDPDVPGRENTANTLPEPFARAGSCTFGRQSV